MLADAHLLIALEGVHSPVRLSAAGNRQLQVNAAAKPASEKSGRCSV